MPEPGAALSAAAGGLRRLVRLPDWLTTAADGTHLGAVLEQAVPELRDGTWRLERCRPSLRLKEDGWAVSCRLDLVDDAGADRLVTLTGRCRPTPTPDTTPPVTEGVLGTTGWRASIPALGLELTAAPEDVGLPAVADLIDPARARLLLSAALGAEIADCRPEIMRYKAGSQCTVRYQLSYPPGAEGPTTVIAKTYRGEKGANAFAGMTALERSGVPPSIVALAPALAYDAARRVLVQGAVPEDRTLKSVAQAAGARGDAASLATLETAAARAGAGLAALHASEVHHGDVVSWDDEHAELCELVDRVAPYAPELSAELRLWLRAVAAEALAHRADPVGTAHRSFRPAQVLLDADGGIAFIDFDGLCIAEPAMDVALFRSALRNDVVHAAPDDAVAARLDAVDAVADVFLRSYAEQRPVSLARVRLWERLYLVTSLLHCWTKLQPARLPGRMAALERHMATVVTAPA